ncbi:MAG: PQQ-binding-like beta-propeller repeat protein, partial [Planctomycetota bacterium]
PQRIPSELENPKAWLKSAVGAGVALRLEKGDNWKLFRGGPNRNASVPGGMPIGKMEWEVPLAAADPKDATKILEWHQENQDNQIPLIPTMQPLGVGNYLLMRTARMMFGVELSSGRRTWPYPDEALEAPNKDVTTPVAYQGYPFRPSATSDPLRQRIWQDAPYAQLSSDGERVFLLRDLQLAGPTLGTTNAIFQGRRGVPFERSNSLVALELESEGKMAWKAGGPDSNDPQLTGAYFLGVPLPLDEHLYTIAEIKDELKLLSIDARNGMLEWSQQLIQLEGSVLNAGSLRRLAGATPSFAEGLLICPTSNGAVVAVELASRSLLWGATYQMKQGSSVNFNRNVFGNSPIRNMRMPIAGTHWVDSTVVIEGGRVLLTPVESDRLVCLDLLTGNPAWPAIPRQDMLYVGAVHEQVALMIGSRAVRGIRIEDGKPAWENIEFREGEYPTGRGFVTDGHYFLPTSRSEILRIRIVDGTIVERQPMDRPLGNIICHSDYLISQSPEGVFAYPLRERRRGQIVKMLKESPNNPDALEDYANLLAADGKNEEAITTMKRAMSNATSNERKREMESLLSRIMINALRDDFPAFQKHLPVAQKITKAPNARFELAKIVVDGTKGQDPPRSFAARLELVDATINKQLLESLRKTSPRRLNGGEPNYRRDHLLDVATEIAETINDAGDQKEQLASMFTDRLRNQDADLDQLSSWARVGNQVAHNIGNATLTSTMNELNLRLADKLIANDQPILADLTLNRLRTTGDTAASAVASAKLAELYESLGRFKRA